MENCRRKQPINFHSRQASVSPKIQCHDTNTGSRLIDPSSGMDGPSVNFCGANFWDSPLEKQVFFTPFFSPPCKNSQKVPHKILTVSASIL